MSEGFAGAVHRGMLKLAPGGVADPTADVCAVFGRINNADALRRELRLAYGTPTPTVVASACAAWGNDAIGRFRGRFSVLLWDAAAREGLLAVDQLGAAPIFYLESGGTLAFGTELRELLALVPATPAPDDLATAQWIADGALQRGRTLYAGVRRLEGGSWIRLKDGDWTFERYWSPRFREPLPGSRSELAEGLRSAITSAVAARLGDGSSVATLLSGGLDSSAIAAVVAGLTPSASYSMTFPGHPTVDESSFIQLVADELEIPSRRVDIREGSLLRPALEFQDAWRWPCVTPTLFQSLAVARRAASDGVAVLFDGEDGDTLFGAPPYLIADALRRGRVRPALALATQLPGLGEHPPRKLTRWILREYGLKGAAPRALHGAVRRVRAPRAYALPWLEKRTQRLLGEADDAWDWKARKPGPRWWAHRVDQLTAGRERLGAHDYLRRKSSLVGLCDAHPFLDDLDLIEFVLRVSPEYAYDSRVSRPLLRAAMEGLLPPEVRRRPHKAAFNEFIEACLAGVDAPALERSVLAPDAEIRSFVDQETVRDVFFRPAPDDRPLGWAGIAWRLATAECWLRAQASGGVGG